MDQIVKKKKIKKLNYAFIYLLYTLVSIDKMNCFKVQMGFHKLLTSIYNNHRAMMNKLRWSISHANLLKGQNK